MIMVILLVLTFRSSSNLAGAYGIAVIGAMLIDSVLISVVLRQMWNWNRFAVAGLLVLFFTVDFTYLSANLLKIPAGGWFPLLVGGDRVHLAHDLGEGPAADDQPDERGEPADGDLHQVGGAERGAGSRAPRCS